MANRRIDMRKIRAVLRLHYEAHQSRRSIARSLGMSRDAVTDYLTRAAAAKLTWPLPASMDDAELERQLFPLVITSGAKRKAEPNWAEIHQELKRKGATLQVLHEEYLAAHPGGIGYSLFCERHREFATTLKRYMRQTYVAGERVFVDYAGPTMVVVDRVSGAIRYAQIFVGVLGASNYIYAEAHWTQSLPDWIAAHVRMFEHFGAVPSVVVCDNLKSAVTKASRTEPVVNATYQAMADHYGSVILPARARKPKDKAKVEGSVLIVERWILARLRNRRFFSLADLNAAISDLVDDLNNRPMRHIGKSRRELFEEVERKALAPLPATPFDYAEWKSAKVHPDYHVEVDKTFYSVPHRLIGRHVDVRLTHRVVEIFFDHKRIASHVRRSQRSGHVTVNDHMPKSHQRYANTTPASLLKQAARIGVNTAILVERMMRDRPHPEQGYRSAFGILSLARRYETDRLEAACERAIAISAPSFGSLKSILKHGLDKHRVATPAQTSLPLDHANVRGPAYFH